MIYAITALTVIVALLAIKLYQTTSHLIEAQSHLIKTRQTLIEFTTNQNTINQITNERLNLFSKQIRHMP